MSACTLACFGEHLGETLRIESALPQQTDSGEKSSRRVTPLSSHFSETPSLSSASNNHSLPCFGGDQDEDCRIDGLCSRAVQLWMPKRTCYSWNVFWGDRGEGGQRA